MIPCGNRPDKDSQADVVTRLRMTQAAIEAVVPEEFPIKCCDIEVSKLGTVNDYSLSAIYRWLTGHLFRQFS